MLTMAIFNFNKIVVNYDSTLDQNRYRLEAMSLMTSYIEICNQYFYDEVSTDTSVEKTVANFTAPGNLGMDVNDGGVIDDFDDFHNQAIADTGGSGIVYNVSFNVQYAKIQNSQIVASAVREYSKRMTISVTDSYNPPLITKMTGAVSVRDTIRISFVYSYWFYN